MWSPLGDYRSHICPWSCRYIQMNLNICGGIILLLPTFLEHWVNGMQSMQSHFSQKSENTQKSSNFLQVVVTNLSWWRWWGNSNGKRIKIQFNFNLLPPTTSSCYNCCCYCAMEKQFSKNNRKFSWKISFYTTFHKFSAMSFPSQLFKPRRHPNN